jgi:Zn-dependent protease
MAEATFCPDCGTELAPGLVSCPGCRRLLHADQLKELAARADQATRDGDFPSALVAWRQALELLPAGSRQHEVVNAKIAELGQRVDANPAPTVPTGTDTDASAGSAGAAGKAGLAGLGAIGLLLWKFKFVAVLVLTKAKFLFLGLTKASTLFSMLLSMGVYWTAFGWRYAVGLVLSIYVHEMGHVYLLRRYGVAAGAPMFIPGFGALIRVKQRFGDPRQDARVGLAGPIWGLGAAVAAAAIGFATNGPIWTAIAKTGATLNLLNLIPIWQLDGGRAFRALGRTGRWFAIAITAIAWSLSEESLLVLVILGGVVRTLGDPGPAQSDRVVLAQYVFLVGALSALTLLPVAV